MARRFGMSQRMRFALDFPTGKPIQLKKPEPKQAEPKQHQPKRRSYVWRAPENKNA